jgi:hypothetical protein
VAVAALAFAMAGPAAAVRMPTPDLPCHNASLSGSAEGGAAAHVASHTLVSAGIAAAGSSALHPDPARQHMCCVVSQLVAPPLALPPLRHPQARSVALLAGPDGSMAGREPAIPVPPPRSS